MSRRVLHHLQAVIDTGSIAAAAKKLFVSQPSLSQYIRRLEEDYDITIFDRSSQPWTLTQEGRYFIETEKEIESIESKRRQYFSDRNALLDGEVTIGTTHYRTNALLGPVLSAFRNKYPKIHVKLIENTSRELVTDLDNAETDCAFIVNVFIPAYLDSIEVFTEEVVLCVARNHPLAQAYPDTGSEGYPVISFDALRNESFIVLKRGQALRLYFDQLCEKCGFTPHIALESESVTTAQPMVIAGLGIALVPSPLIEKNNPKLRYFSFGSSIPPNTLSIAWSKKRYRSKATEAFIQTVIEVLGKRQN